MSRNLKCHQNLTKITGTFHLDLYTVLIISRSVLRRMRNISDKKCRENQNTHFMSSDFFSPEERAVYGDNVEKIL